MEAMYEVIGKMLANNKYSAVKELISEINVVDIAAIIEEIDSEEEQVRLFRLLPKQSSADVFSYLDSDVQSNIIKAITNKEIAFLVEDMFIDDAVDFLDEMPAGVVTRVLSQTTEETRSMINRILRYPDNSAGSIMTTEMVSIPESHTVKQAISDIRRTAIDKETIYTCYCTDDKRILKGSVPLRRLILAPEDELVRNIMFDDEQLIFVNTLDDQEEVAAIAKKYDLLSIPVVDKEQRLVGIITIDDIVDVIEDENTEDFEKMALLQPSDNEYLKTGVFTLFKNRIFWLLILMVSATFTSQIIEGFEDKLALVAGLTASIPILMGTGGNCGNQVSTLIIRGLALGDIEIKDYFKILWKEIRVAFLCGVTLATANFIRMWIMRMITGGEAESSTFIVVCLAMMCSVVVAKAIGCTLPILAKLMKLDPALMAGPVITTILDALTLIIYFGIATAFINYGLI